MKSSVSLAEEYRQMGVNLAYENAFSSNDVSKLHRSTNKIVIEFIDGSKLTISTLDKMHVDEPK